jgi:hypothetical protein
VPFCFRCPNPRYPAGTQRTCDYQLMVS